MNTGWDIHPLLPHNSITTWQISIRTRLLGNWNNNYGLVAQVNIYSGPQFNLQRIRPNCPNPVTIK